jgi:multiple sugar transport system substrate-binding protein
MKRFVIVLLAALLLVSMMPVAAQDTTIEVYITGLNEDSMNWFRDELFPAFEEANPGVDVEILTGGWGDFDATVAGWITTGDGPDVIYLGSEYAATFGPLLADLDPYLGDWEDLEQYLPTTLETVTFDGHLRGLPLLISPRPIFYRTDLFAEGSAVPTTFAESLEFVAANTASDDTGLTMQGFMDIGGGLFDAQEFIAYIWSAGGELYNEDGTSAFDSEATREALQYMYDRRRTVLPTESQAGLQPIEGTPLGSGRVVSGIFPMWNVPALSDEVWNSVEIAPYPAGENGEPVVQVFIDWLSVPAYVPEEKLPLVTDFLKFVGSKDNAIALSAVQGFTPARVDAWEELRANNPVWAKLLELAETYGRSFSDIRASAELRPLITEQVNLFLTDQQSIETTMETLKEEYDAILEDNGYLD